MRILYAPAFLRQLKHLPPDLREQALAAIEAFQNRENHVHLKVHKLKGRLAGQYAFSVNFHYRITF